MKRFLSFFSLLLIAAVQMWAVPANPIAQITIGEDITSYYNPSELKTAAEAIEGEATIKILNDVTIANGLDFTKDDSNVILDLNGYTFTTWIYVSNSLTIRDNSDGKTGKMVKSSDGVLLYVEEGSLTIDGGTFVGTWCVYLDYQGHVTLNGGKFEAETYSFYLDSNDASLTLGKNKMMVNWIGRECQLVRGAIEGPCRVMEKTTPDPMAQITIGGTVTEYNELEIASFMHAAEFIEGEATVKLLTDVTLYDRLTFGEANTNITLDLNGCTFKCNIVVTGENSRLTICDSSDKQTGKIENSEDDFVINNIENGSLIIDGGMIVGQKGICLSDDASLTINGGLVDVTETGIQFESENAKATLHEGKGLKLHDGRILSTIKGDISGSFQVVNLADYSPIAQITIGETTTKHYDVEEFRTDFASIEGTATVKLLRDITLPDEELLVNKNSDADITLDLNGHNITGNCEDDAVIYVNGNKLTIVGDGIVENIGESGDAVGSGGTLVINEGTYIGAADICFTSATMIINGGKFKAPYLYYRELDKPIVYGGIFSMDPTDCVAEGYEVVANDDEVYKYKVVAKGATAIESINADKAQKAVKTIENGKVVIIRGEKKYDLSGREL